MGAVQWCRVQDCRWYVGGPLGKIRYYRVPSTNRLYLGPNAFDPNQHWEESDLGGDDGSCGPVFNSFWKYDKGRNFRPDFTGEHIAGTEADFAGLTPLPAVVLPPDCLDRPPFGVLQFFQFPYALPMMERVEFDLKWEEFTWPHPLWYRPPGLVEPAAWESTYWPGSPDLVPNLYDPDEWYYPDGPGGVPALLIKWFGEDPGDAGEWSGGGGGFPATQLAIFMVVTPLEDGPDLAAGAVLTMLGDPPSYRFGVEEGELRYWSPDGHYEAEYVLTTGLTEIFWVHVSNERLAIGVGGVVLLEEAGQHFSQFLWTQTRVTGGVGAKVLISEIRFFQESLTLDAFNKNLHALQITYGAQPCLVLDPGGDLVLDPGGCLQLD